MVEAGSATSEALRGHGVRSPGFHPGEQRKAAVVRGQAAVVGVHIRIDGWGLRTGGLPPFCPWPRVELLATTTVGR